MTLTHWISLALSLTALTIAVLNWRASRRNLRAAREHHARILQAAARTEAASAQGDQLLDQIERNTGHSTRP